LSIRFSVVIPAYNASRTIASSIRSVFQQVEQDFEVIVVDDGSTDDTAERARSVVAGDRVQVISQPNAGASAARNVGIRAAKGVYVSMLDADDLWLPWYLTVMGEALDGDLEGGFAYTDAWLLEDETKRVRRTSVMFYENPPDPPPPDLHTFLLRLLERNFIYGSVTVRRSVFDEVGGYDESLVIGEDWEQWLRMVANGVRPVRTPGLSAIYRTHRKQLTSNMAQIVEDHAKIYRRFADDPDVEPDVREVASRRLAYWTTRADETLAVRARWMAFNMKRRLQRPWLWPRHRPEAVVRTLEAVGEITSR